MDPQGGKQEIANVQELLTAHVQGHDKVRVLEAGCGSLSHFDFSDQTYVVGIDISAEQLEKNPMLHERILGDIETYEFSPNEFDIIVCWYVFEHLPHPEQALRRLLRRFGTVVSSCSPCQISTQ